jgi:AraC-like DNA-binding protein
MKIYLKYDINVVCRKVLEEQLEKLNLQYNILGISELELKTNLFNGQQEHLNKALKEYGIEIVENQKSALVQKIKDTISEIVHLEDKLPNAKISSYLAERLHHSYGYLANLFSEITFTSIENYVIMQKIERAKQLLTIDQLTLTEIAYKLNYSSVAHLSNQFKKTTGLTPSAFQRIINKRRNATLS